MIYPPGAVRGVLEQHSHLYQLLEVVMDLGRPPTARFPGRDERLDSNPVTQEDLDYAVAQVSGCFTLMDCLLHVVCLLVDPV